jgi:rhomboid protease GluP
MVAPVSLEFPGVLAHPVDMTRRPAFHTDLSAVLSTYAVLIVLVVICTGIELTLQGADFGLWGSPRWRGLAYQNGGFWRGLLDNWQPNYPGQPALMFATYSFLHVGAVHLLVNMITLASLGRLVIERVGQGRFAVIYALSLLGGAAGFALLSTAVQPMVGASGALFGLAGVLTGWEYTERRLAREGLGPVLRVVALLIGLNLVMYWAMGGNLAWETHLGGFLAGWVAGWWVRARDPRM